MGRHATILAGLALAALAVATFAGVLGNGFVAYDDPLYVTENAVVQGGLTAHGIAFAFRSLFEAGNWHPLTWLSHMADVELFGLDPRGHHATSLALHAVNAVLLFGWLATATGSPWRSLFAAALWAVHPLRVESVAWVAERKDVLSTACWLLAMWAYLAWTRRPTGARYAGVAALLALGLMAKAMVVTLPAALLLLDVWPLRRLSLAGGAVAGAALAGVDRHVLRRRLLEKAPLLAGSLAVSAITIVAQSEKALATVERISPGERLANAAVAAAGYLRDAVWPADLAVLYPHPAVQPGGIPVWHVAAAALLLAALTAGAVRLARVRPAVLVGWLWFLGTLVPVIGLVQVGVQGSADRYTYVPMIGLAISVAWLLPAPGARGARLALAGTAAAAVLGAAAAARAQVARWRDTETLFEHTVRVTERNWQAWEILAGEYDRQGRRDEAQRAFQEVVSAAPGDPAGWRNLATERARRGDHAGAAALLERAVRVDPADVETWYALAVAYAWLERPDLVAGLVPRLRAVDPARADELARRLTPP